MYAFPFFKKPESVIRTFSLALLIICLFSTNMNAQVKILQANDSILGMKKEGLLYCLPQTKLVIRLHLSKTTHTKGLYAANAKEMLGIEATLPESGNVFAIEGGELVETAIPDPSQYYLVTFSKCDLHRKPVLQLSPESFLMSLNKKRFEPSERIEETFTSGEVMHSVNAMDQYTYHLNPNLFKTTTADTSRFPRYFFRVKPTDDPLMKGARDAAENLARIKENKVNLLSGYQEIAYEQNTFYAMLNGLEAEEEKALRLFTGTTDIFVSEIEIPVLPDENDTLPIVIGHFSKTNGFSQNPMAEGKAVTLTLTPLKNFTAVPSKTSKKSKTKNSKGFVVREPAWVVSEIRMEEEIIFTQTVCLPQFGHITRLPLRTKEAIFDVKTGAIQFYR